MLNQVTIMGRLTRDPELRRTGSGIAVANFTVAVDRDFTSQDSGEKETDFIDCVAWRQTGEFVSKYFTKGRMIVVSGRIQVRSWTDKEGNKRKSTEVVADNCYFGDSKKPEEQSSGASNYGGYPNGGNNYGGYPNGGGNNYGGNPGYSGNPNANNYGGNPGYPNGANNYGGNPGYNGNPGGGNNYPNGMPAQADPAAPADQSHSYQSDLSSNPYANYGGYGDPMLG